MEKFTKGKWIAGKNRIITEDDYVICEVYDGLSPIRTMNQQIAKANCKLIASAPEMLEALKEVSPFIDNLIHQTPTGIAREILTGLNIKIKTAITNATK